MNLPLRVLLFLLCVAPLAAGEPSAQPEISLTNVRWQPLPSTVEKVFVGPDGRTWYRCDNSRLRRSNVRHITTVAGIKQQIEQEFQKASPQLEDIEPALFEPGGRVWFSLCPVGHLLLLGYDGKEWTEYTILDPGGSITGRCPTRGELLEGRTNRFAGGTAWFITQSGVLRFDGKRWQHQKLVDKPKLSRYGHVYRSDGIWLAVSPDGQAAVAYACEAGEFSIFKQGKWSPYKAADPKDSMWDVAPPPRGRSNTRKEKMQGLVLPDNQTAWYLVSSGLLRQLSLSTDDEAISPSEDSSDVSKDDNRVASEDLGQLSECRQVYEDGNGRVFIIAAKIDGQDDGVAIVQRDRKVTMLLGATLASAWRMTYREDIPPILTQSGDQVWLANRETADPPKLLDLKKGEFVDSLPNPEFSRLHAVSEDGRVFVSVALPQGTRPIAVYTPGAPNSDSPLKVSHIAAASHKYAITDKGMVWVNTPDGLTRFDGYQWRAVGGTKGDRSQFLLPGHNDTMLVLNERTATFYEGQQEVASGERFDFFQHHRDRMKKAFGPGSSFGQVLGAGASNCGVLIDRSDNIWCLEPSGRLLVENQGSWRDTNEALTSAGSRAGHVVSMALIGDGSKLYIGDKNVQTVGGQAFFGELKNGKPSFVSAPQQHEFSDQPHDVTDRDGMLWVYNSSKRSQTAYRINGQSVPQNLGDVGAPVLADEAGNVWLCDIRGPIQDTYNVWRDGKVVQRVQIPHADRNTFLFSDQPGSVYAWTISGLQHLVADGPTFDKYRLERLYPLEGISGQSLSRAYSKHGYLVTLTALDTRTAPYYYLYLIKLPGSTLDGMTTHDGAGVPGTVPSLSTPARHVQECDITEFIKPVLPNQQTDVENLKRVIKETVKPKSAERQPSNADVEALLRWSKPVNGLIARIEYVWAKSVFFVRLKNVSDRPLVVPTANSSSEGDDGLFDVYTQQGSSPWQRITHTDRFDRYFPAPWKTESKVSQSSRSQEQGARGRQPIDRPAVTLEPDEDCIAMVTGSSKKEGTGEPKTVKVVLRQPNASTAGRWSGVLETPPRPMLLSPDQDLGLRGTVPFPVHFPPLSHDYSGFMNRSPDTSLVEQLHGSNQPLISILTIYEPAGVRTEFERRMQAERKMPMKLLLASAAAVAGSEEAATLFLNTMKDTDYRAVVNLHYALWATYRNCTSRLPDGKREQPPTWLEELFLAALSDHRAVTGMEQTNFRKGTSFTVSSCATEKLVFALEGARCRKAVPLLVERVKRREADWHTLHALGEIGDPRAVSALIQGVKEAYFNEQLYEQAVYALGKLKARDAVPALLQDIEYVVCIDALAEIGDSRAVPAIQQLVTTKGQIIRNEKSVSPEHDVERFHAAKVALCYFDAKDGVVQLAKMLDDPTLTRSQRYDVVFRLGEWSDPRTVPYLVRIIKTEPDFHIVSLAITGLVKLQNRAAVEGLIDCFDVTFKPQDLGKGERVTPATCRNRIAQGLQRITGQSFGADKQLWLRWLTEEGSKTLK